MVVDTSKESFSDRILDAVIQIVFRFCVLVIPVHEYGHLISLRLMGYAGEIRSTMLNATWPLEYHLMSPTERTIFFLSGGFFQAFVFGVLCLFNVDEESSLANKIIVIQGVLYGLAEGFFPYEFLGVGGIIALLVSFVFMVYVFMRWSRRAP